MHTFMIWIASLTLGAGPYFQAEGYTIKPELSKPAAQLPAEDALERVKDDAEAAKTDAEAAKADAEKAKADAEAAKTDAEKAAQKAEEAAKKLDEKLDELAGGKFIEYGITGGIALGIHAPLPRGTWQQQSGEVTALPYVLIIPAFWSTKQETNRFCASHWTKGQREAQRAADNLALERARETRKVLIDAIKSRTAMTLEEARNTFDGDLSSETFDCAKAVAGGQKTCSEDLLDRKISRDTLGWVPNAGGPRFHCAFHKFGLWLGVPINTYKARVSGSEFGITSDGETREVRQRVAFGLGLSINSWFSILIGASYGTLDVITMNMAGDAVARRGNIWAITIAPAFNIDLVRAFVGRLP